MRKLGVFAAVACACLASPASALPDLWKQVGFPVMTNVIVYQDHVDPNQYYVLPNVIVFEKDAEGNTMFSMSHQGVTKADIDGVSGRVNFTAKAAFHDNNFMQNVWGPFQQQHPGAVLSIMPGDRARVEFFLLPELISGSTAPPPIGDSGNGDVTTITVPTPPDTTITTDPAANSPNVEIKFDIAADATAGMAAGPPNTPFAFQTSLNRLGSRILAYSDEGIETIEEADRPLAMIVRYQYVYKGLGPRYKIKIAVDWKRLQTYYQHNSSKSKWFGLSKSQDVTIVKDLKDNAAITYEILEGALSPSQADEAAANELFKMLSTARVNGTGLFKPAFEPSNPGGGGGGSGLLGWGSSSRTFSETLSQEVTSTFIMEKKETEERLFPLAYSIGEFCEASPELFINLTDPNHQCITAEDIEKLRVASAKCASEQADFIKLATERYVKGEITLASFYQVKDTLVGECLKVTDR